MEALQDLGIWDEFVEDYMESEVYKTKQVPVVDFLKNLEEYSLRYVIQTFAQWHSTVNGADFWVDVWANLSEQEMKKDQQ